MIVIDVKESTPIIIPLDDTNYFEIKGEAS